MWIEIIVFFSGLIALIIFIVMQFKMNKDIQKISITANMPLVENIVRKHLTEGYSHGVLKSITPKKNGTCLIEFYPDDVEQGEGVPRPDVKSLIVRKEYIKSFARGINSARRETIKLIGRSQLDYPKEIRNLQEVELETKEGQIAYLESVFGKMIPSGDEAIAEIMKRYARGSPKKGVLDEFEQEIKKMKSIQSIQSSSVPENKNNT